MVVYNKIKILGAVLVKKTNGTIPVMLHSGAISVLKEKLLLMESSFSNCNRIRTDNHLVCKRILL